MMSLWHGQRTYNSKEVINPASLLTHIIFFACHFHRGIKQLYSNGSEMLSEIKQFACHFSLCYNLTAVIMRQY